MKEAQGGCSSHWLTVLPWWVFPHRHGVTRECGGCVCDLPGSPRPAHASPAKQQELKAQRGALRRRRNLAKTLVGSPARRSWCAQPPGAVGAGGSVLVDAEEPHAVELGQLGQEDAEQGGRVDHKVRGVVLGVEAGEEVPGGGREGARGLFCAALLPWGQGGDFGGASLLFPV